MSDSIDLETAALNAKAARARLAGTASELQERLAPSSLLDEAVSGVKDGAGALAQTSVAAARKRPGVAAGIAAAAFALLVHRTVRRRSRGKKETD